MTASAPGRHEATAPPPERKPLGAALRDAVSPRTVALVLGVLVLQLGFTCPTSGPSTRRHRTELAVVGRRQVVAQLNGVAGESLHAVPVADESSARARLRTGPAPAALVVDPLGTTDTLLVAAGTATATAVETVLTAVEQSQRRTVKAAEVVPLQAGDGRGLTGFYLVIGWIVGGYLVAALLGVAK